jgi:flagellar biosynthesis protein FlgN
MKPSAEVLDYLELVRADIREYHDLRDLLEQQFQAALRHQIESLRAVGERIVERVDGLQRRRAQRLAVAASVTGAAPLAAHAALQRRLTGRPAALLQDWTAQLQALVGECQQMNQRNCALITDQHEIMRRVLNQEESTYAPA